MQLRVNRERRRIGAASRLSIAIACALAQALVGFVSCNEPDPLLNCDGSFESVQKYVFEPACAGVGCHSGSDPAAVLDLTLPEAEQALVTVAAGTCEDQILVRPHDVEGSFLWNKVQAQTPVCGEPMPMARGLRALELACLRRWLEVVDESRGPGPGCETCGGEACVVLETDEAHCGDCNTVCGAGSECIGGVCQCAGGLDLCTDRCVDTSADSAHCGGCGAACPPGALCNVGECVCGGGLTACGADCVDTSSSAVHCGTCDAPCASGEVCLRSTCATGCDDLAQCGSSCVDTQSSVEHCGACDRPCPAGASCLLGACACPLGTSECAGQCLSTDSDPQNCGACGVICPGGLLCTAGACECPDGGVACASGCVDVMTDELNCGACNTTCGAGQSCVTGVCTCGTADTVSFSQDVEPALIGGCTSRGCHDQTAKAELDLRAGIAYAELVGVAASQCGERDLVVPGDPSQSYLMQKLLGQNMCQGSQMPKAGQSIPAGELDLVGAWICQGALDN